MTRTRILLIALVGIVVVLTAQYLQPKSPPIVQSALTSVLPSQENLSQFAQATDPAFLTFPDAFGPHEQFQTEWWYYTGNAQTVTGEKFGYQLTFFRRSLGASADESAEQSAFRTNQAYMAHLAITDVNRVQHYQSERFERGAAELAGARVTPYEVWLDNWSVEEVGNGIYKLYAETTTLDGHDLSLNLTLTAMKIPVLQGNAGLSQKGPELGNATYYYSQTRLETYGDIKIDSKTYTVTGFSWKDHEFGTTALGENIVGWDWYSFQFDDNTELMLYNLRNEDGTNAPTSSGTFVSEDGSSEALEWSDVDITVLDSWQSPHSQGNYPSRWRISIPSKGIDITVIPLISDQEMTNSTIYWEGAVQISGTHSGYGYVELTGYGGPLPLL